MLLIKDRQKRLVTLANFYLVATTIIFISYNITLTFTKLPPFFGGFYTLTSIFFLILFSPFYHEFFKTGRHVNNFFLYTILIWFLYVIGLSFAHFILHAASIDGAVVNQSLQMAFLSLLLVITGTYFSFGKQMKRIYVIFHFFLFIILVGFALNVNHDVFFGDYAIISENKTYLSGRQAYARVEVITLFLLLSFLREWTLQWFILLTGIISLYIIGARSEMLAFILVVSIFHFVQIAWSLKNRMNLNKINITRNIMLTVVVASFLTIIVMMPKSKNQDIFHITSSTSYQERVVLNQLALDTIKTHPIAGKFGDHTRYNGKVGGYAHNILSAWVNYGLFGFLLYLTIIVSSFVLALSQLLKNRLDNPYYKLSLFLNTNSIILIFVAKSVFWMLPALGWGVLIKNLTHKSGFVD